MFEAGQVDFSELLRTHINANVKLLSAEEKEKTKVGMNENAIRFYWQSMLECIRVCHQHQVSSSLSSASCAVAVSALPPPSLHINCLLVACSCWMFVNLIAAVAH